MSQDYNPENKISCCKQLTNQMDRGYKCKKIVKIIIPKIRGNMLNVINSIWLYVKANRLTLSSLTLASCLTEVPETKLTLAASHSRYARLTSTLSADDITILIQWADGIAVTCLAAQCGLQIPVTSLYEGKMKQKIQLKIFVWKR